MSTQDADTANISVYQTAVCLTVMKLTDNHCVSGFMAFCLLLTVSPVTLTPEVNTVFTAVMTAVCGG